MKIRYEIQRSSGTIDLGDLEYSDEEIQEIIDDHVAHEATATWEKVTPKSNTP